MSVPGRFRLVIFPLLFISLSIAMESRVLADEPVVRFDVPALVGVHEIAYPEGHEPLGDQMTIEVVIPVSLEVDSGERGNVEEIRCDIYWNRSAYPLVDYVPKTKTVSGIEGLVAIETTDSRNSGVGIKLSSQYLDVVSGSVNADHSNRSGTKRSYSEIPQHEILVASGSVRRGTGAFFRFHPSKRETLEGGRDLVVVFRVPQSWSGGVLKIECRANGHRKVLGAWRESFDAEQAFVVPIYLESDDQARQAAFEFVRSEQGLRRDWRRYQNRTARAKAGMFSKPTHGSPSKSRLPHQWVHYLIQSGSDDYLTKYRSRLPGDLENSADKFAAARSGLLELSR